MLLELFVTPSGRLGCERRVVVEGELVPGIDVAHDVAAGLLAAFTESSAAGLLALAPLRTQTPLPPEVPYWRRWTLRFLKAVAQLDDAQFVALEQAASKGAKSTESRLPPAVISRLAPPDSLQLAALVAEAPPMRGLEFITPATLASLWQQLPEEFLRQAAREEGGCRSLLARLNPETQLLGRVTFHLAENKRDTQHPFAFLATFAQRLTSRAQVQHQPLAAALREYAAAKDQAQLAELLIPVREAANHSAVVAELLKSRAIFQPQAWTVAQAHRFLLDVPKMEAAGLSVRVPDWWAARREVRPQVQVRIGEQRGEGTGMGSLLDFSADLSLDGKPLTDEERDALLAATDGLLLLRGRWVEVDAQKLREALRHWRKIEEEHADGISFLEGMRMLSGIQLSATGVAASEAPEWSTIRTGAWLEDVLRQLRDPGEIEGCQPGKSLQATLRPYQAEGVRWLWFMLRLGLGACLADDMGLGKTIQVIDLILQLRAVDEGAARGKSKSRAAAEVGPCLLIVPASLVGNWKQELQRFAPQLRVCLAHRSESDGETLAAIARRPMEELAGYDVVVTTYTLVRREEWPKKVAWRLVVLDEAQAIRNAGSAQSKAVRQLRSSGRIVLTGTPVENHLGDLWSLFDFCVPGLLGSLNQFKTFVKRVQKESESGSVAGLRRLVRPYILRRMKSDPRIVPDLPDKTELTVSCGLSKKQVVLYEKLTRDVAEQLEKAEGIQRKGLVLSLLMRLKQLCNHPDQMLAQKQFAEADSGKFLLLRQLGETIREQQAKVLVFTQFQSLCDPLANFLAEVFQRPGLMLHGGVPVGKRKELVAQFQNRDDLPFFVISLKAGGSGLNLTAASHVVHFDRWWNPAVENQATDRAYRIGQKRNVLVHKLVCRGTLEERIDQTIRDKQELADDILGEGGEKLLTEMSDAELMKFVSLDVSRASVDD